MVFDTDKGLLALWLESCSQSHDHKTTDVKLQRSLVYSGYVPASEAGSNYAWTEKSYEAGCYIPVNTWSFLSLALASMKATFTFSLPPTRTLVIIIHGQ